MKNIAYMNMRLKDIMEEKESMRSKDIMKEKEIKERERERERERLGR